MFANYSSYRLGVGAYSLYFDFGSSGANASQNLAYGTGSGAFFNSNGEHGEAGRSFQQLTDNIIVYPASTATDAKVVKWRTLVPTGQARRNIFSVGAGAWPASGNQTFELFQDHTSTHPQQWDEFEWDDNCYFAAGAPHDPAPFGSTWPVRSNLSAWRETGHDQHSLIADPEFEDAERGVFKLRPSSPALTRLGFREWDHSMVGPACGAAERSPVCPDKTDEALPLLNEPH